MSNKIIRPIATDLGYDEYGQFWVGWHDAGSFCMSPCPDLRDHTCSICGKGWEISAVAFRNQTKTNLFRGDYCHLTCWEGHLAATEAQMWHKFLCYPKDREEFLSFKWHKIQNEYRGGWNVTWYRIDFLNYIPWLKLGARRSVFHMSIHDLRPEQVLLFAELTKGENVTRDTGHSGASIHAHTEEDAQRYISIFSKVIRLDMPLEDTQGAIVTKIDLKKETPQIIDAG